MDDLGILMAIYEQSQFKQLTDQIDPQDFYQPPENKYVENGIPKLFHTTLCQGLKSDLSESELINYLGLTEEYQTPKAQDKTPETLLKTLFSESPIVKEIYFFTREEYDILVLMMSSDIFTAVNNKLREISSQDFLNQHPIYYPHTTLGSLKKGKYKKYLDLKIPEDFNWQIISLYYSSGLENKNFKIQL